MCVGVYEPLPFFRRSQNLDGEVASPGKRHASPTMAMGACAGLLVEGMFATGSTTPLLL